MIDIPTVKYLWIHEIRGKFTAHTHTYKLHKLKFALDLWLDARIYNLTLWVTESERTILSSPKLTFKNRANQKSCRI